MKKLLFLFLHITVITYSQNVDHIPSNDSIQIAMEIPQDSVLNVQRGFPEGAYTSFKEVVNKTPSTTIKYTFKKRTMGGFKITSPSIDSIFAIVTGGKLYLQSSNLFPTLDKSSQEYLKYDIFTGVFIEFEIAGNNLIAEYIFEDKDNMMIAGQFGLIGGIVAASMMDQTYLVYFSNIEKIHVFDNKKDFLEYISIYFPNKVGLYEKMTNPKISELIKLKSVLEQLDLP